METEQLKLCRFPPGERCDECGARRYYEEGGFRYCKRGHRQEGFIRYTLETEDGFGVLAKKSQRAAETNEEREGRRKKKGKRLGGRQGQELYLECVQLVLRKQLWYLIHEQPQEFPAHLQDVARNLWDLRIKCFPGLNDTGGLGGEGNEDPISSADEGTLFSSQAFQAEEDESEVSRPGIDWSASPWQMPRLVETLGIIYLACILLRLPIGIGKLHMLVKTKQLPFFSVVSTNPHSIQAATKPGTVTDAIQQASELPSNMLDHLAQPHLQVFDLQSDLWKGDEIHHIVRQLVLGYHKHYDLVFPEINWPRLAMGYIQQLALPSWYLFYSASSFPATSTRK